MKYLFFLGCLIIFSCQQDVVDNTSNINKEKTITNEEINSAIAQEEKLKIDSIGILVYDGFFDLDVFGPYSVLSGLLGTKVFFVAEKKGLVKTSSGLEVVVNNQLDEIKQLDILLVPGGLTETVLASKNTSIINWIKEIDKTTTFTTSVCTGAWILGEAGLLESKKATTNWYRAQEKLKEYNAEFVDKRWVQDGKIWTSAGVSAGIDMSLALVNEIKGETYAKLIMLNLEYNPNPPFQGGAVHNTNKGMVNYMAEMYDTALGKK